MKGVIKMSEEVKVQDLVDAILNPVREQKPLVEQENLVWEEFNFKGEVKDFSLKQEVLPEGSAIVEERITEVSVVDLKGKTFKFPGHFRMERFGDKIKFIAIS
jgi:hypothetical protein